MSKSDFNRTISENDDNEQTKKLMTKIETLLHTLDIKYKCLQILIFEAFENWAANGKQTEPSERGRGNHDKNILKAVLDKMVETDIERKIIKLGLWRLVLMDENIEKTLLVLAAKLKGISESEHKCLSLLLTQTEEFDEPSGENSLKDLLSLDDLDVALPADGHTEEEKEIFIQLFALGYEELLTKADDIQTQKLQNVLNNVEKKWDIPSERAIEKLSSWIDSLITEKKVKLVQMASRCKDSLSHTDVHAENNESSKENYSGDARHQYFGNMQNSNIGDDICLSQNAVNCISYEVFDTESLIGGHLIATGPLKFAFMTGREITEHMTPNRTKLFCIDGNNEKVPDKITDIIHSDEWYEVIISPFYCNTGNENSMMFLGFIWNLNSVSTVQQKSDKLEQKQTIVVLTQSKKFKESGNFELYNQLNKSLDNYDSINEHSKLPQENEAVCKSNKKVDKCHPRETTLKDQRRKLFSNKRHPTRYTVVLSNEHDIRRYLSDTLEEVKSRGLLTLFSENSDKIPHIMWPSGHPLLPSKIRFLNESRNDYYSEHMDRIQSFVLGKNESNKNWSDQRYVRPEPLVNAGFSYEGIEDEVICKHCGCRSRTDEWTDDDEAYAMEIHRNFNSNCPFFSSNPDMTRARSKSERNTVTERRDIVLQVLTYETEYLPLNTSHIPLREKLNCNNSKDDSKDTNDGKQLNTSDDSDQNVANFKAKTELLRKDSYVHLDLSYKIFNSFTHVLLYFKKQFRLENCENYRKDEEYLHLKRNTSNCISSLDRLNQAGNNYKTPYMAREENRINSFHLRGDQEMRPLSMMATNGFYYTGIRDVARCFCCGLSVADLNITEVQRVDIIHSIHMPNCEFLIESIGRTEVYNIREEWIELRRVMHPEYRDLDKRQASFAEENLFDNAMHGSLAQAGFFFSGISDDRANCFYCGVMITTQCLTSLSAVWDCHILEFPFCGYVLKTKGTTYVRDVFRQAMIKSRQSTSTIRYRI